MLWFVNWVWGYFGGAQIYKSGQKLNKICEIGEDYYKLSQAHTHYCHFKGEGVTLKETLKRIVVIIYILYNKLLKLFSNL